MKRFFQATHGPAKGFGTVAQTTAHHGVMPNMSGSHKTVSISYILKMDKIYPLLN